MGLCLIMCTLKILTDLCLIKQNIKAKNTFVKIVYSVLVVKMYCLNIKKIGKQNVKLEEGVISFKNYFRQIPVPFKIHAHFECILKNIGHIPCSFGYKVVCVDNKYSKKIVLYRGRNAVNKFIKSILNESNYCRKVMKNHLIKT